MYPLKEASVWHVFSRYVGTALHALEAAGSPHAHEGGRTVLSILVLARTRAMTSDLPSEKVLGSQLLHTLRKVGIRRFHQAEVKVTTYHGSKELEANFVLLLGDRALRSITRCAKHSSARPRSSTVWEPFCRTRAPKRGASGMSL